MPRPARESDNGSTLDAARDAGDIASVLRVIWFQDDSAFPIDPFVLSQFAAVDWEDHAIGWLQRRAAPLSCRRRRDSQSPDHLIRCFAGATYALLGRYVVDGIPHSRESRPIRSANVTLSVLTWHCFPRVLRSIM